MIEALLAIGLVALSHALRVRYGLNLADEGFLWNGVLRIGQGQIPIRDYKSYDPFRFYWSDFWMRLFGKGILGLRHASALFQALGLWAGLSALSMVTDDLVLLALSGVVLVLWMHPRHKLFEHAMSLITLYALAQMLAAPALGIAFVAGVVAGFAGFVGRNHGLYAGAAMGLGLAVIWLSGTVDAIGPLFWAGLGGALVGYSPMLIMFLTVRDMFDIYIYQKILVFLRRDRSTITLDAPLPWRTRFAALAPLDRVSQLLEGVVFLALPVFALGGLAWLIFGPGGLSQPTITAAILTGLFYMHHAAARSDLAHLCQAAHPMLLGLLALIILGLGPGLAWLGLGGLIVLTLMVVRRIDPRLLYLENAKAYTEYDLLGERLYIPQGIAQLLNDVLSLQERFIKPGERMFIAPRTPLLYPVLRQRTPVRSDYMLFPEDGPAQDRIIADLTRNRVVWALIQETPRDDREELRFCNTHAKVWDHIAENFERIPHSGLNRQWSVWFNRAVAKDD